MKKLFGKKTLFIAAAATMLFNTAGVPVSASEAEPQEGDTYALSIVHDNDIHGRIDRLPQFKTLIDEAREEIDNLLVLNGGDIFL